MDNCEHHLVKTTRVRIYDANESRLVDNECADCGEKLYHPLVKESPDARN
jgi:RNase P subunit RPR2